MKYFFTAEVKHCVQGCMADPSASPRDPSVMSFDAQFLHNLPINARQMHVMLLCAELAGLSGSGSAQAMR